MTISSTPAFPLAGHAVTLASTAGGDSIVVWALTSAPVSSAIERDFQRLAKGLRVNSPNDDAAGLDLAKSLKDPPRSAVDIARLGMQRADFTPDAPGPYTFTAFFVRHRPGLPAFLGDGAGDERFELVGSETGTIHVGGLVDLPITTNAGDGALVRLQVNDATVETAALVVPANEKSRVAAEDPTVVAALAALVGQAIGSVGPNLETAATELRTQYEAHRKFGGVTGSEPHPVADTINVVARTEANSATGAIELGAALYEALVAHLTTGSSQATSWHSAAGPVNHDDLKNLPLAPKPSTLAQLTVALADLRYRVYERHRVQTADPACHRNADATNALGAATLLESLIVAFLDALAEGAPTAPAGESQGLDDAAHRYGFEAPLAPGAAAAGVAGVVVVTSSAPPQLGTDGLYSCDASIAVDDCVRIAAPDTIDKADATSAATMPANGIVISKPDATHAVVRPLGEIAGVLSGLTPGATYYVDTIAGAITASTAAFGPGNVEQKIGFAKDATTLVAQFDGDTTTL